MVQSNDLGPLAEEADEGAAVATTGTWESGTVSGGVPASPGGVFPKDEGRLYGGGSEPGISDSWDDVSRVEFDLTGVL